MKEIMTFSIILRMSDSLVEIPSLFKHKGLRTVGKGLKGGTVVRKLVTVS